jgi:O-succinylbenzoic acid--CoA ligase
VISLVPTQLQRLLALPAAVTWLRGFRLIFVGGGPVWPELADAAAKAELPVSLSYGLTETAAMVTALRPAEFLAGARSSGSALPHARVTVDGDGAVTVAGESVFRGYFPDESAARAFPTDDLGRLDEQGHLHLLGRRDAVIITGGKKVQPAEVEAALRASGEFSDVAVVGLPDPEWGNIVVACYPAGGRVPDLARMPAALAGLAAFKRPKRYIALADWPRNAQGKLNRAAVAAAVRAAG